MFTVFTFLTILLSLLPLNAVAIDNANPQNGNATLNWQIKNFPTPYGIQNAVEEISENKTNNNSNSLSHESNNPGQIISNIARSDHDGGISLEVHNVIEEQKSDNATPTVTPTPGPTIDRGNPTPSEVDPKPIAEPKGCPPCGNGNGKFECPMVMCAY